MNNSSSQFSLLLQRRFGFYYLTQLFGAFNDNVFKNALILMIAFQVVDLDLNVNTLVNLSAGLFILPFFLFSATAGQLADKYEKSSLMRKIKLLEVVIMLCAALAFYLQNISVLIGLLFLMGTQSTLFGPVKFGILPQHLKSEELVGGNALVEAGTFMAILIGIIVGGSLIADKESGTYYVSLVLVCTAVAGYLSSRGIPLAKAADPKIKINWNPITETWRNFHFTRQNRVVFLSILGVSWFWFLGATYLTQLPNYTKIELGAGEQVVTFLLALFSIGIGVGSLLCERLSGHKVEIGLVPLGSIGLSVFGIDLYFAGIVNHSAELLNTEAFLQLPGAWRLTIDFVMIGIFGGFYIVPLYAMILQRSEPSHRSRIIASNNILNALFMVLSAAIAIVVLNSGFSISDLFLILALLNIAVAVYIYSLVPEFLVRFLVWLLTHSIYRVKKIGLHHIPDEGPAILVCNHVSFADSLLIAGAIRRPVRFVMYYKIFKIPMLSFIFKSVKAIPIAGAREDITMLKKAYADISQALRDGDLICIFPEGEITNDGEIHTFKPGVKKMLERDPVPVIPMALSGLWGSLFSRKDGPIIKRRPRKFLAKITLALSEPIPADEFDTRLIEDKVRMLRQEK